MRKIEQRMNAAIIAERDWQQGNTAVINNEDCTEVLLHGNKIAEIGDTYVQLFDGGHRTATTKSRLNAILKVHCIEGECVFQRTLSGSFTVYRSAGRAKSTTVRLKNRFILS
jgi:hypothetical protein